MLITRANPVLMPVKQSTGSKPIKSVVTFTELDYFNTANKELLKEELVSGEFIMGSGRKKPVKIYYSASSPDKRVICDANGKQILVYDYKNHYRTGNKESEIFERELMNSYDGKVQLEILQSRIKGNTHKFLKGEIRLNLGLFQIKRKFPDDKDITSFVVARSPISWSSGLSEDEYDDFAAQTALNSALSAATFTTIISGD